MRGFINEAKKHNFRHVAHGYFEEKNKEHGRIENMLALGTRYDFREGKSRILESNSAEFFAVVRHLALNLLKKEKSHKRGIKSEHYKAALDIKYAEKCFLLYLK